MDLLRLVCFGIIALGLVILVFYVREKIRAYTVRAVVLKALVSCCFMAVAAVGAVASGAAGFGALMLMGLLFGLLGDVWLDLKYVHREQDVPYTFAGFWSFAVGHAFFIAALLSSYADFSRPLYFILPVVIATAVGIGNVSLGPVMKLDYGRFAGITRFYGSILFSMTLISGALAMMHGFNITTLNMIFIGGVLFIISDLVLSGTYFGKGHEKPVDIILNYIFYYGAQFVIALSVAFA